MNLSAASRSHVVGLPAGRMASMAGTNWMHVVLELALWFQDSGKNVVVYSQSLQQFHNHSLRSYCLGRRFHRVQTCGLSEEIGEGGPCGTNAYYWSVDTWIHFLGMYCSFCRLDLRFAVREGNGNSSATLLVEGGMRGASKTHQS